MIYRTLRPRSAWRYVINMFWYTDHAITPTTRGGERSRLSCARPKDCRPSRFTQKPATTHLRTDFRCGARKAASRFAIFLIQMVLGAGALFAQIPVQNAPPPPPPEQQGTGNAQSGS